MPVIRVGPTCEWPDETCGRPVYEDLLCRQHHDLLADGGRQRLDDSRPVEEGEGVDPAGDQDQANHETGRGQRLRREASVSTLPKASGGRLGRRVVHDRPDIVNDLCEYDCELARSIAILVYNGRVDRVGLPEVDHCRRVAQAVSDRAKPVAWLHDAVEDDLVTIDDLEVLGLGSPELAALRLLTRDRAVKYMVYIGRIAAADGTAGRLAREVKLADLRDNMSRPCPPGMLAMRSPDGRYDRARQSLLAASNSASWPLPADDSAGFPLPETRRRTRAGR